MFKANVGTSTQADSRQAGKEAGAAAAAGLNQIKLAFVYAGCDHDLKALLTGVGESLPGVMLLGNTSFTGVITPAGYCGGNTPFVGVMALAGDELKVGVAAVAKDGCAVANGNALAKAAMAAAGESVAPDYFYMAASPAEEEFYLKGITEVIGRVPCFGGSAADNTIAGQWSLYTNDALFADGCIVAFFYHAPAMTNIFTGAYRETGDFGVITGVRDNRTLVSIDNVPACEKYRQWTGVSAEAVTGGNLLVTTITSPLGVKDRLGDLVAIRHPMNGNDDGSMNIGANLAEKTCVIRMAATVDELIDSVPETLEALTKKMGKQPAALHLVHCGGRRAGIGDRIGEVTEALTSRLNVPFIMEFTFGEYGFVGDDKNTTGGLMLSFTGFAE